MQWPSLLASDEQMVEAIDWIIFKLKQPFLEVFGLRSTILLMFSKHAMT